jgi:hypothetical protein
MAGRHSHNSRRAGTHAEGAPITNEVSTLCHLSYLSLPCCGTGAGSFGKYVDIANSNWRASGALLS